MSGKGDKQRPTDHEAYSTNYDLIFGKKNKVVEEPQEDTRDKSTEADTAL